MIVPKPTQTFFAGRLTYVMGFVSWVCLVILGFLVYGQSASEKMIVRNVPSIDAVMMVKFELAQSHLWLEEYLAGGGENYAVMAVKHCENAKWYGNALLQGGENHEGTFQPVSDDVFRAQIKDILTDLEHINTLAAFRIANPDVSAAGSTADEEYDRTYQQIITKADNAEIRLKDFIFKEQHQFANVQLMITLMVSILMATLIAGIYFYHRQNVRESKKKLRQFTAQRMLTKCTAAALEASTEKEFLNEIVEWMVRIGGFGFSWVGFIKDDNSETFKQMACSARNANFIEGKLVSYGDGTEGNGPAGRAVRSGEIVVVNDLHTDEAFVPWRDEALRRGLFSAVGVPLILGGRVFGAFTCYGRTVNEFGDFEIKIFHALASNIVLGLQMLRSQKELQQNVIERTHDLRKLSMAVEQSGDMTFITDTNGLIEYVNRQFTKLTGYELEDVRGKTPRVLRHPDTPKSLHQDLWQTLAKGRVWRGEIQDRSKAGSSFWSEVTISPIFDSNGEITHYVSSHRDIRERKEAEFQMRDALRQTQIANKAKTELLANMSHELRTPLNAVIGFSEAFIMQMYGPLGHEKYDEYAKDISYSGKHLLELINDILDVSAIEAGRLKLNDGTCDFMKIVQSSVRLAQARATVENIIIEVEPAIDLPMVLIDERRMKQILLNLLSNAVKFTEPGGKVSINAAKSEAGGIVCEISDTGIGMDSADVVIALSEFGQVDGGLDRKNEGSGLGLPLSVKLIEQHNGYLEIDSNIGMGTTVRFFLPKERVTAASKDSQNGLSTG